MCVYTLSTTRDLPMGAIWSLKFKGQHCDGKPLKFANCLQVNTSSTLMATDAGRTVRISELESESGQMAKDSWSEEDGPLSAF